VQITYSKTAVDQFDFKAGCGLVKTKNSGGSPPSGAAFAVCLLLFLPLLMTIFGRIQGSRAATRHSRHQR
jgi:hypothetical protein